jgi:hypothetical protein
MRSLVGVVLSLAFAYSGFAQGAITVTGTAIPAALVKQTYGAAPKGVSAYDVNICNTSAVKQSIVSSEIYQALSGQSGVEPIGRQIMLASILRSQNHSVPSIVRMSLTSAMAVLSVLSSSKYHVPSGLVTGAAMASISGQQVLSDLSPLLSADQLEKFETQALEPALALDAGSCVERTVFAVSRTAQSKPQSLSFHVR